MCDFLSAWCKIQLNCCIVLRPDIEVLHICSRGLWTAGAGTEQIQSTPYLPEVNTYTKVKPIGSAVGAET